MLGLCLVTARGPSLWLQRAGLLPRAARAPRCGGLLWQGPGSGHLWARALGTRASVVAARVLGSVAHGLQGTGSVVAVTGLGTPCMWHLPGPGIKLVSPALQGRFLTMPLELFMG